MKWAMKVGELKPLGREGLLLLGARCARRVEPWAPANAKALRDEGVAYVVRAAFEVPEATSASAGAALARKISDAGAIAATRLEATDAVLGRCANYAGLVLAATVDACVAAPRATVAKAILEAAKYAASIGAILAHAGRVETDAGVDAVELAATAMWDAIRADVPLVVTATQDGPPGDIEDLGPLWPAGRPRWVPSG